MGHRNIPCPPNLNACYAFCMLPNQHIQQVLLYLAPSIILAFVIKGLSGRFILFSFLTIAGTFFHELAHFIVGFLTNARPVSMNLIPRRVDDNNYQMGTVTFSNVRWYNAAITGLAPIIILAIPILFAEWRISYSNEFTWWDVAAMFLLAPQFLCFWPSSVDWMMALRSWPYLLIPVGWYLVNEFGLPSFSLNY